MKKTETRVRPEMLLTIAEFAEKAKISPKTIWRWIRADRIPGAVQRTERLWLIPESSLAKISRPTMGRPKGEKVNV